MKKILMIVALAIATVGVASAQLDVKVDANVSCSNFYDTGIDVFGVSIGYRAGLSVEIPIATGRFFFAPGIVFQSKGTKISVDEKFTSMSSFDFELPAFTLKADASVRTHYIKLPLLLGTRFRFADNMGLSLQVGPYLAYAHSGKMSIKLKELSGAGEDVSLEEINAELNKISIDPFKNQQWLEDKPVFNRFDAGATFSAAFEYSKLYFQVGTDIGFVDIPNVDNAKAKNIDFFVGAGYRF